MGDELIKERAPSILNLGGKEYTLPPLNLNGMANIEEEFNCGIDKIEGLLGGKQATALRDLIYALLKDNYPDITKIEIGKYINISNLEEVSQKLADILSGE